MQEKSQLGVRKLNRKQERSLVCGIVASSRVLIFAVIGHNTISIPEISQVSKVFLASHAGVFRGARFSSLPIPPMWGGMKNELP